jgi:hypothetical protein
MPSIDSTALLWLCMYQAMLRVFDEFYALIKQAITAQISLLPCTTYLVTGLTIVGRNTCSPAGACYSMHPVLFSPLMLTHLSLLPALFEQPCNNSKQQSRFPSPSLRALPLRTGQRSSTAPRSIRSHPHNRAVHCPGSHHALSHSQQLHA